MTTSAPAQRHPQTLAELLAAPGLGKRKREATHFEGIPVGVILEQPKAAREREREVRTPRRRGLDCAQRAAPDAPAPADMDTDTDDDDDIVVLV